jgi:hypothetical protein
VPLIAWITNDVHKSELEGHSSMIYEHWSHILCKEPNNLINKSFADLKPNQLNCKENENLKYSNHFIDKSDLRIRAIEWSRRRKNSVRIVWFVVNRIDDIASFRLILKNENQILINESLEYNNREYVANKLNDRNKYIVCINAIDSNGNQRQYFNSQCVRFDSSDTNVENFVKINWNSDEFALLSTNINVSTHLKTSNYLVLFVITLELLNYLFIFYK